MRKNKLHEKNQTFFKLLFCLWLVVMGVYTAFEPDLSSILAVLMVGAVCVTISYFLLRTKRDVLTMYVNSSMLFVFVVGILLSELHVVAIFLFLPIAFASLYQDRRPIILTFVLTLLFMLYLLKNKPDAFAFEWNIITILYPIAQLIILFFINFYNSKVNEGLQIESEREKEKIVRAMQENQHVLHQVEQSVEVVNDFNKVIAQQISTTENSNEEIVTTFGNMLSTIEMRNQSLFDINNKVNDFQKNLDQVDFAVQHSTQTSSEGNLIVADVQENLNRLAVSINTMVDATQQNMDNTKNLLSKSERISEITQAIQVISEKTNLLALNASIEAARAGEHGKGFSVVANEIKKLSSLSRENSETIATILSEIKEGTVNVSKIATFNNQNLRLGRDNIQNMLQSFDELKAKNASMQLENTETAGNMGQLREYTQGIADDIINISSISEENEASLHAVNAKIQQVQSLLGKSKEDTETLDIQLDALEQLTKQSKL